MDAQRVIKDTLEIASVVAITSKKRDEFLVALKKSEIVVTDDLRLLGTVNEEKVNALMHNLQSMPVLKLALRRATRKYSSAGS